MRKTIFFAMILGLIFVICSSPLVCAQEAEENPKINARQPGGKGQGITTSSRLAAGIRQRIESHALVVKGVLTNPYESLQMGNGDMGASVSLYPHELKITLAKADVWDARYDGRDVVFGTKKGLSYTVVYN